MDAAALSISKTSTRTNFRWVVGALIFLVYTIAAADRANLGFALPFIRKEFAMSNTEAGALVSLFLLAYSIAQLPSGFTYSKFGIPKVFCVAMLATSALTAMIGTSASILMLKFYRFGLGLAEGPLPVGITSTINNWFPPREKGTATGIFLAAAKFGPVLVPPVCAAIVLALGWRYIFFIFAVPGVLLSAVWYFTVANRPSDSRFCSQSEVDYIAESGAVTLQKQRKTKSFVWLDRVIRRHPVTTLDTNASVFRSWNIIGTALAYFFMTGVVNVLLAWIPTYLLSVKHYSIANMGLVAAAPWVGAVIGNLAGGMFTDRILDKRRKPAMMISAFATVVMMVVLINSPADPFYYGMMLLLTGVLLNFGYSTYMVYPMAMTSKKVYPIASAFINTLGQLGGACSPLIAGFLLDHYNWDYVFVFMALCSVFCLLTLLTIVEPVEQKNGVHVQPA